MAMFLEESNETMSIRSVLASAVMSSRTSSIPGTLSPILSTKHLFRQHTRAKEGEAACVNGALKRNDIKEK